MFCVIHWCKDKLCFIYISCNFLFFETDEKISYKKRASIFFTAFIFWGNVLFCQYGLKINLTLSWLTAARPIEQGFIGLMSRFI